jgi:rhamnulokinase
MEPFSCLAVDMGAGSIRVVQGIFTDRLTIQEIYRFENHIEWIDGADRWNLKKITEGIQLGIEKAFKQTEVPISSIGVDSWGVDFVLIGEDGLPLEDAVSYRDKRTIGIKEQWNKLMSEEETVRITGINYNIFNSLYQFLSLKGLPQLAKTKRILFMADYINYVLSGVAVNELTLAATSQMVNCVSKNFDKQILHLLELNPSIFSKPVMAGQKLGCLKDSRLNKTEVMVVAGHDTACAVAAIPFTNENFAFISTGTWCIMGMLSETPFSGKEAFEMGITNEVAADGIFRPSKNLIGLWLIQQLRVAFQSNLSYSEIEELASNTPKSDLLVDTSDESLYNPTNMKEAFDNYFETHFSSKLSRESEYYRCAYDSLVESFRKTLTDFEKIRGITFETIHMIGGGSQSKLLCQLTANALKFQVVAGPVEGAAIGNLMTQAIACGYVPSPGIGREMIRNSFETVMYFPEEKKQRPYSRCSI